VTARQVLWPGFFAALLVAWAALWTMGQEARGFAAYGPDFWRALCRAGAADLAYLPLAAMWAVMAAAMMAPTAMPALKTFLDLPPPAGRADAAALFLGGFLSLWGLAAFGFALLQLTLARAGLVAPDGQSLSPALSAALLILAGLYQLSPLKSACLARCRAPLSFFLAHWRPGPAAAYRMGLRLGADCLGCCWALMLLAFWGGMSNLLFMGLATLIMVLEKLPEIGRWITRPLAVLLLMAGLAYAARAIGG